MYIAGFDIGGTKCAVILANVNENNIEFLAREQIETDKSWQSVIDILCDKLILQAQKNNIKISEIKQCGVSCGGPLDSENGLILSPPNLIGWNNVPICEYLQNKMGCPVKLKNDADACAVAEWKYGAGKGKNNIVFLTFGTGLGAGLVLNGQLYIGKNNMAGEIGHIRISSNGPVGYGKSGSFEGFCSGKGIQQQINTYFLEKEQQGIISKYYKNTDSVTAKDLAFWAEKGDEDALCIFDRVGENFGKGLSIIIDFLNPEVIIVGGVYMRSYKFMENGMWRILKKECLSVSLNTVKIHPSQLGEKIGDYGAVVASF